MSKKLIKITIRLLQLRLIIVELAASIDGHPALQSKYLKGLSNTELRPRARMCSTALLVSVHQHL